MKDTMNHEDWKRHALEQLKTLRDEVRLELHLAGMEAKDEWRKLEPRLHEAEKLAEDVGTVSKQAVEDILNRVRHFRRSIQARA